MTSALEPMSLIMLIPEEEQDKYLAPQHQNTKAFCHATQIKGKN